MSSEPCTEGTWFPVSHTLKRAWKHLVGSFLQRGHRVFLLSSSFWGKLWELSCGRLDGYRYAHSEIKLHKNVARSGAGVVINVPAAVLMKGKVSSSRARYPQS